MLKTFPARFTAASYSFFSSPEASSSSTSLRCAMEQFCRRSCTREAGMHKLPLRSTEGERVGTPEDALPDDELRREEDRSGSGSAEVGGRVAGILEAAEQAAEQIRADALRQAHETMRRAEADAEVRIDELTREAGRVRSDAEDYARDIRHA